MSYKIGQLISSEQQSTKERVNTINGKSLKLSIRYNLYEGATSVKYDAFYLGNGTLEVGNVIEGKYEDVIDEYENKIKRH